ncbi:energy transducer TonB [bacterium]|nr:energy transducer TonB [bacterium]
MSFAQREERKRWLVSGGLTMGLYGLILGAGLLFGILNPKVEMFSDTTVLINLPGPITNSIGLGSINPSDQGDEALTTEPPAPAAAPKTAKAEPAKTPAPATKAVSVAPPAKPAAPKTPGSSMLEPQTAPVAPPVEQVPGQAVPVPAATAPGAADAQPAAAEPWVPGQREQGSHISDTSSMLYVPGKGNVPWTGSTTSIHKAEKGTSSDTKLGGAQGTVGYNIYVPIYYSLPLPQQVPASVYNAIPDLVQPPNTVIYSAQARKRAFSLYYEFDGASYRLKSDVPVDKREPLWEILDDAGFDFAVANFWKEKNLMPVVIGFTVTRDKQVKGVEVLQSSGDSDIDKAVLYGFKRAVLWNKTGETVPGRFRYPSSQF